ncbi:MAG: hypothetical protein AAFX02_02530, partial [Pseudomonadota bacterium]
MAAELVGSCCEASEEEPFVQVDPGDIFNGEIRAKRVLDAISTIFNEFCDGESERQVSLRRADLQPGTVGYGLPSYTLKDAPFETAIPAEPVNNMLTGPDGRTWVASALLGLLSMAPDGSWASLSVEDGLHLPRVTQGAMSLSESGEIVTATASGATVLPADIVDR